MRAWPSADKSRNPTAAKHRASRCQRLLDKCIKLQAFPIGRHRARLDLALDQLMDWYRAGRLKFLEPVAQGLEAAPAALINVPSGGKIGKQVVRLAAATE